MHAHHTEPRAPPSVRHRPPSLGGLTGRRAVAFCVDDQLVHRQLLPLDAGPILLVPDTDEWRLGVRPEVASSHNKVAQLLGSLQVLAPPLLVDC